MCGLYGKWAARLGLFFVGDQRRKTHAYYTAHRVGIIWYNLSFFGEVKLSKR